MLTLRQIQKLAGDVVESAKWVGALGDGCPLEHVERCSMQIRELADGMISALGHRNFQSAYTDDMIRACQMLVGAQHSLLRSRMVHPEDRVCEIAASEALLGEILDILERAAKSEGRQQDTLAPSLM